MLRSFNNIEKARFDTSLLRKIFTQFIIVFFAFSFSIQQLQAYSFKHNNVATKNDSTVKFERATKFSITLPQEHLPAAMEMEVLEDENEQNTEYVSNAALSQKFISEELFYNSILRSRYLQLAFSAQQHPAVPFFILHHSWKNYIA